VLYVSNQKNANYQVNGLSRFLIRIAYIGFALSLHEPADGFVGVVVAVPSGTLPMFVLL